MFNKLFGKKPAEPTPSPILEHDQIWPQLPTRQRFRRTRSAASESVYADYVSDDWGVAPTILHDRYGQEIRRTPSINSLEEWQQNTNANANALFRNVSARVRSLSVSRPNWARAPPTYGWAQRVEQAGGQDERQMRRDEERAHRPVTIPVPNPAPGPIDVKREDDPELAAAEGATTALQAPALVRRKSSTRRDDTVKAGRMALGHRSTTSSPTIIPQAQTTGAGPSSKHGPGGRRRHLSRVEKIAAVLQHVSSLPLFAETPVQTYYPRTDKDKIEDQKAKAIPAEPFHTYNVPPSVPKRYQAPPVPLPTGWYQPKQPKPKKPKKDNKKSRKTMTNLGGVAGDSSLDLDFSDEFEYPDFDNYGYTGDTPTLQSDESSLFYEQVNPKMIEGAPYSIRPAFFPGPIKSTGLTTHGRDEEDESRGPLRIMPAPPPGEEFDPGVGGFEPGVGGFMPGMGPGLAPIPGAYGYYDDNYDDDDYESESSRGPIPSTLTPSGTGAPPLVIPTPTGRHPAMPFPMPEPGQPFARYYEAAPGAEQAPPLPGGYGPSASAQGWHPAEPRPSAQEWGLPERKVSASSERRPSAQGWGRERGASAQGWGQERGPSAQGWALPERRTSAQGVGHERRPSTQGFGHERRPLAQGWGTSPGPARGMSAQGWTPPDRRPSAQDLGIPTRKPFEPPTEPVDGGWAEPSGGGWGDHPGGWGDSTGDEWVESGEEGWGNPASDRQGPSAQGWGELPKRRPSAQDWDRPAPMAYGFPQPPYVFVQPTHGRGYEPAPQTAYGPSLHGPSPHSTHGRSPHTAYGPSPGAPPPPLGPSPQNPYGPSPQAVYAAYPYGYYPQAQPFWDPYGVVPDGFHITDSPRKQHRGDSPPPIPSPIATSVALSRTSRRRSEAT
ncbi:Tyrosine-protein phosphatase non-receptor type 23 [Ceratobasidium sp. AG-Ba]|nr:Tyrosine-protein phosphatase non-receptor type 23 [Ceratobasidium sp. AG-Ba]QRW03340.1 Tyrosine-protein phosphatase non-receptor type 23 [Ceratobasidium sp. AG-Ba]